MWLENEGQYPSLAWIKDKLYYELYEEWGTDLLGAFVVGSEAKGIARPDSDLDIAVIIEPVEGHPDPLKLSELYHSNFMSDWDKPRWGDDGRIVDFQFFYPNSPELKTYSKIPLS